MFIECEKATGIVSDRVAVNIGIGKIDI